MDKMKKPLISIILPVYNVEQYVRHSLDSIFCQDTSDCEIILINDGSSDGSLSILREYENKYSNIRVIDKVNEGVSATRNRGLDECNGEYFYFMDSDDRLHPDLLSFLKNEIKGSQPDIITWDFSTYYTTPKYAIIPVDLIIEQVENSHKEAFNYLMSKGIAVSLCSKAIRKDLVNHNLRFDPTMSYGEDLFFSWKVILLASNIRYIHIPLYYYLQSNNSATSRFHMNLYEHYRKAFNDIYKFIKEYKMDSDEVLNSIDYHFACRLPALTSMEAKAPYSLEQKKAHLSLILKDVNIQNGLKHNPKLNSEIFLFAREGDVGKMLKMARITSIKSKLMFPLKKLFK